jgi:hypothetical protein
MNGDAVYRHAEGVLSRSFADEVLLAAPRRDEVDQLSGPAADVWVILDQPLRVDDIVERLRKLYGAPVERVRDDVQALLNDLVERGWLEVVEEHED